MKKKIGEPFAHTLARIIASICFKYQLCSLIFLNTKDADPGGSGVSKDQKHH